MKTLLVYADAHIEAREWDSLIILVPYASKFHDSEDIRVIITDDNGVPRSDFEPIVMRFNGLVAKKGIYDPDYPAIMVHKVPESIMDI